MRRVSIVEAHSTTSGAATKERAPLRPSTTTTPSAREASPAMRRWLTMQRLRSLTRPVARARARVTPWALEAGQGRSGVGRCSAKPREWISGSPSSLAIVRWRCSSAGVKGRAGRYSPSGSWGRPSQWPCTPSNRSNRAYQGARSWLSIGQAGPMPSRSPERNSWSERRRVMPPQVRLRPPTWRPRVQRNGASSGVR